ncbi:hypothetical protein evm_005898 [Chilo suppressalis]|nr:hypothetical protein evm_005898 [Chilo suppressalis]
MKGPNHVGRVFIEILLLLLITDAYLAERSTNAQDLLSRLLRLSGKRPVVLVLELPTKPKNSKKDNIFRVDDKKSLDYNYYMGFNDEKADDTNDDFDTSSLDELKPKMVSSSNSLEASKNILRTALRTRCYQVYSCVEKCPPKRPSCPLNCQQVFDVLNLCKLPTTPDPCRKPRCGKTMPPKWRLL